MGKMAPVPFNLHNLLTRWQSGLFAIAVVITLIAIAVWYLRADWKLAARGRRWPRHRTFFFLCGLVAVDLALQSSVATFTASYFQAHVAQHLLLMIIAPPLLALGAPSTLLLQTSSRKVKRTWLMVLKSKPFALLTHPLTVWMLYFGAMFAFFLSQTINVAMHHMWLMDAINIAFLVASTMYWWPLVGIDPVVHWRMGYGARMVNVLLGVAPEMILGLAILTQARPIASMYSLSSTHAGGAILWISTEFSSLIAFVPIFVLWIRSEERAAARADAREQRLAAEAAVASSAPSQAPAPAATPAAVAPAARAASALGRPGEAESELTVWESYWLARTGKVPPRTVTG
jgi:putative copper resistance protein D